MLLIVPLWPPATESFVLFNFGFFCVLLLFNMLKRLQCVVMLLIVPLLRHSGCVLRYFEVLKIVVCCYVVDCASLAACQVCLCVKVF